MLEEVSGSTYILANVAHLWLSAYHIGPQRDITLTRICFVVGRRGCFQLLKKEITIRVTIQCASAGLIIEVLSL